MVDQQRRRARVRDLSEPLTEVLALARVETGRGLVEAEEPRPHRDRARHADELPLALRELGGHRVRDAGEIEELERLVGRLAGRDPSPDDLRRQREERGPLRSDFEILAHREIVEQLGALPRPGETAAGAGVRRQPCEIPSVELDRTRVAARSR